MKCFKDAGTSGDGILLARKRVAFVGVTDLLGCAGHGRQCSWIQKLPSYKLEYHDEAQISSEIEGHLLEESVKKYWQGDWQDVVCFREHG
jgi:hypothetical protein